MSAESADGWPAFAPALICLVKRALEISQSEESPSGCGSGSTRRCAHSSASARSTAASVTSLPTSAATSNAVRGPRRVSASQVASASCETFSGPVAAGGCFQALSPRSVKT